MLLFLALIGLGFILFKASKILTSAGTFLESVSDSIADRHVHVKYKPQQKPHQMLPKPEDLKFKDDVKKEIDSMLEGIEGEYDS